jgi:hypothetical protein
MGDSKNSTQSLLKLSEEKAKEEDLKNEHIYTFAKENLFQLPEFDFPHYVCLIDSTPSENSLITDFMKIAEHLQLEEIRNLGISVLLNEKWMFVSTLSKPYLQMENGLDLFVDPFSYGGIMNVHIKKHAWPQTAGIGVEQLSDFLPSKKFSEPQSHQLPEPEKELEAEGEEYGDEKEGEENEGEGEGDKDEDNDN